MKSTVAAALGACALSLWAGMAHAQTYQISMPLGGTSGTFYSQGAALADYINSNTDAIRIVPSTSGGSVENIRLVGSGQSQFGMAFDGDIFGAWEGEGFEKPYQDYRQIGPAQKTSGWNFIVLADSDVETLQDLEGRQFVPGAPGSGSAADADRFLRHVGWYDRLDISYYSWGELGRMLTDGDIDGFNRTGAAPSGWAQEIDATRPIKVLDLGPLIEESGFLEEYPFFGTITVPAGTYNGQEEDAVTFAQGVQWIVHKDVPDEAVTAFLELAYTEEAAAHMDSTFPDHDHRNTDWLDRLYVPLHPAAEAFWEARGHDIPQPAHQ